MDSETPAVRIEVEPNGPYAVYGAPALRMQTITTDSDGNSRDYEQGRSFPLKDPAYLCRCGHSNNKPYCDGTHRKVEVDLEETASFDPITDDAERIVGVDTVVTDNPTYCAYGRFCDADQSIWVEATLPGAEHEQITREMVRNCPGGRLEQWNKETGAAIEPDLEQALDLIEDPSLGAISGPIRATGGIPVVSASGKAYPVRNRVALCRCGASSNKPFCDGSHASIEFADGLGIATTDTAE